MTVLNVSHSQAQLVHNSDLGQRFEQNQDTSLQAEKLEELMLEEELMDFLPEIDYEFPVENETNIFDLHLSDISIPELVDQMKQQSATNCDNTLPYQCSHCDINFGEKSEVVEHCRNKHEQFLCETCFVFFPNEHKLKEHQKLESHSNSQLNVELENTIQCKLCAENFDKNNVCRHYNQRHKKTLCPYCFDFFGRSTEVQKHCLTLHNEPLRKKKQLSLTCNHCGKVYHRHNSYKSHLESHIPDEEKLRCNVCQRKFINKSRLKFHALKHKGEASYKCSKCSKSFYDSSTLRKHIVDVHAKKQFSCTHCDVKFKTARSLRDHVKNKHETCWVYNCSICNKSYSNEQDCLKHYQSHDKEESWKDPFYITSPFECQICNQYFGNRTQFQLHMMRKHGLGAKDWENGEKLYHAQNAELKSLKTYQCHFCSKKFTTKMQLRIHIGRHLKKLLC